MTETRSRVPEVRNAAASGPDRRYAEPVFDLCNVRFSYGEFLTLRDVNLTICEREITALIGPSGCGKSTLLRCLNRMNDMIPRTRVGGTIRYRGQDIYHPDVDAIEVRRRVGMVFQKPNPFPKSIFDNVAFGPRANGIKGGIDDVVEECLTKAALWDEVKHKLKRSALSLSGGQQQRLCIARTIATRPDVVLMDEPCSALDPVATLHIEQLMCELKNEYTIVIVTHNMQQAARVADMTVFLTTERDEQGRRTGVLVEAAATEQLFTSPRDQRTDDYITGRFG